MLKAAFRHHAAGVVVITADVGGDPVALTASSFTSVSDEPAIALFSLALGTGTGRRLATAGSVAVHLLSEGDHALAVRCADPTVTDRFAAPATWHRLPTGEPVFDGPRLVLRGQVIDRREYGGSMVVVVMITAVEQRSEEGTDPSRPLAYLDRRWHALGAGSAIG